MEFIRSIVVFILIMGVLIFVHELGHLIAAKCCGVYCAESAIGMGPVVYSWQGKETKYSLRALPLGGFVSMAGEHEGETTIFPESLDPSRFLNRIHPLKRMVVLSAGVFMNIVLGLLLFVLVFTLHATPSTTSSVIAEVSVNSPAEKAGILPEDKIIGVIVNQEEFVVDNYNDLAMATVNNQEALTYIINRDGQEMRFEMQPEYNEAYQAYQVGVSFWSEPGPTVGLFEALPMSVVYVGSMIKLIASTLGQLFRGVGFENMAGPIGIFRETQTIVSYGFWPVIQLGALLSINLAIFNILPIPALDGGRIIFALYELVVGKPANKKIENALIIGSFVLLIGLIILVSVQDIARLV